MIPEIALWASNANIVYRTVTNSSQIRWYLIHIKCELSLLTARREIIAFNSQRTGTFFAVVFISIDRVAEITYSAVFTSKMEIFFVC